MKTKKPDRTRTLRRPDPLLEVAPCSECGADARRRWVGDHWVHAKKPEHLHSAKVVSR